MACYFFYGTLMDAAVRAAVLGRLLPKTAIRAAELAGWRRVYRSGATFPVSCRPPDHASMGSPSTASPQEDGKARSLRRTRTIASAG